MKKEKPKNPRDKRPTIGLLTRDVSSEWGAPLWAGAVDAARERGANLVVFTGGMLGSPGGFEGQANVLYELAGAENVDGLVIWTGLLGHHIGPQGMQEFCAQYGDLPVISLELPLEGIPSLMGDFHQGVRDLIVHLIGVHGYRRIAFIRGPEESPTAEERYRTYVDTLAEFGIPFDPALVAPGTFFEPSGAEAVRLLLDERKVEFQAIVAANDHMALDALQALQARGLRVPGEIAIAGYDDARAAQSATPPLTPCGCPCMSGGGRGWRPFWRGCVASKCPNRCACLCSWWCASRAAAPIWR
jgi:DNA-binding LacI/PurR family transcriptional regulator